MAGIASLGGAVHSGSLSPVPMSTPEEQKVFRIFLRLLSVAQFSLAAIAIPAIALVLMMYDDMAARAAHPNNAAEVHALESNRPMFVALVVVAGLAAVGGVLSGICILRRRGRQFSQGVAIVSLILFPIGTVIGLVTLVILGQKPIRDLYKP